LEEGKKRGWRREGGVGLGFEGIKRRKGRTHAPGVGASASGRKKEARPLRALPGRRRQGTRWRQVGLLGFRLKEGSGPEIEIRLFKEKQWRKRVEEKNGKRFAEFDLLF
jgi:hypothetical protein